MSGDGHPARHRAAVVYQMRRPCHPLFLSVFSSTLLASHGLAAKGCESSCKPKGGLPSATPEANVGTLPTVCETQTYMRNREKTILGLIFLSFASMIPASVSEWNRHNRSNPMQCRRLAAQKVERLERLEFLERHREGGCQRGAAHDYPGRLRGLTKSEPKDGYEIVTSRKR